MLLCVLIYLISYIQVVFRRNAVRKLWGGCTVSGKLHRSPARHGNTVLLLLVHSTVYRIYQCRTAAGCDLLIPDFIAYGGLGKSCSSDEYFRAKVAILYVVLGLVIAVAGGTLIEKLHMENQVEEFIRRASAVDIASPTLTQKERLVYAKDQVAETFKKVFPYILIGVGIGAVIHNWIPESWVVAVLGSHNPFGVILATIIGIPMYADIFGTIPIAEALLGKGAQLGTVLAFMMGVTTLSLPSMIMLRKAVKPKLLGVFIAICALGIIVVGYLFNLFQGFIL